MNVTNIRTLADLASAFVGLVNSLIPVLASLALVLFFVGLIRYIYEAGDAKGHALGKDFIIWGLVALFVLFSLWGIMSVMCTVFLGGSCGNSIYNADTGLYQQSGPPTQGGVYPI